MTNINCCYYEKLGNHAIMVAKGDSCLFHAYDETADAWLERPPLYLNTCTETYRVPFNVEQPHVRVGIFYFVAFQVFGTVEKCDTSCRRES